jgi:hypothetical protein
MGLSHGSFEFLFRLFQATCERQHDTQIVVAGRQLSEKS